jgi:cellobiose epimerase
MIRRMLARFLILFCLAASVLAAEPTADELRAQAERCKRLLRESLIRFYLPRSLDHEHGGYHEILKDGQFANYGEKFLTLQARHVWFFATLAQEGYERNDSLAAAKHGFEFLQAKFRDSQHGGYYSKVTDAGEPKDPRKHSYLNSFALYAFAAYYKASLNPRALAAAQELFGVLEARAHDSEHGGYLEFFERDWKPVTDPQAQGYVGAIGHKTYNTHLHLLESFAELFRVWPDEKVRRRLAELLIINTSTILIPEVSSNVDAFERNWNIVRTPRNLRASYGHDVECVWLVLDAARTIGNSPSLLLNWARGLTESSLEFGFDRQHGGFYAGGPLGKPADDLKKTWWVQTEALLGLLEMYRLTKDARYWDAFSKTLDFCEKFHIAEEGGWWATREADGSPANDKSRTGPWQGGYHAGRALMLSAKWLNQLAEAR